MFFFSIFAQNSFIMLDTYCYHITVFKKDKFVTKLVLQPNINVDGGFRDRRHTYCVRPDSYLTDELIFCDYEPTLFEQSVFLYDSITLESWIREVMHYGFELSFDKRSLFSWSEKEQEDEIAKTI